MAAATSQAVLGRFQGSSLQSAFPQINPSNPQNLDLIQIVNSGLGLSATPSCDINVDYTGAVHNPAVNPTNGTCIGVFFSNITSGGTTAQFFASAFTNLSQLDIIQIINLGGNISYWLDYLGVAHGA